MLPDITFLAIQQFSYLTPQFLLPDTTFLSIRQVCYLTQFLLLQTFCNTQLGRNVHSVNRQGLLLLLFACFIQLPVCDKTSTTHDTPSLRAAPPFPLPARPDLPPWLLSSWRLHFSQHRVHENPAAQPLSTPRPLATTAHQGLSPPQHTKASRHHSTPRPLATTAHQGLSPPPAQILLQLTSPAQESTSTNTTSPSRVTSNPCWPLSLYYWLNTESGTLARTNQNPRHESLTWRRSSSISSH